MLEDIDEKIHPTSVKVFASSSACSVALSPSHRQKRTGFGPYARREKVHGPSGPVLPWKPVLAHCGVF